ncbi:MAG: AI-2E family transporter [Marinilabiliaceae bacterium]|nr:AI-2E family transporter [Marinilabiliaceae bacterium]
MEGLNKIYILLLIVLGVVVLIVGQSIIVPFILAVLFWFMIRIVRSLLMKIRYIKKLPAGLLTTFSTLVMLAVLGSFATLISSNIQQLSLALPQYESNINIIVDSINQKFSIDIAGLIVDYTADFDFAGILTDIFGVLTSLFGDVVTVLIFLLFILLEEPTFSKKLRAMYPDNNKHQHISEMIAKISTSINGYLTVKTFTSFLTGFLSYFCLLFIGVDAPLFWAFLIFILNYIPTIGSLIATLFPTIFAMLQFGDISPAILVVSIVGAIQILVGNILEPRIMGSSLNISPLVVIITLFVWGAIWGVLGMLLSVPITVMIIIVLSEFENTRPIAILLSQKGSLG